MKPNDDESKPQPLRPRSIRDKCPWCWQSKQMLRAINDIFDATNDIASARSVYVALTEFASDNQSETFTSPIGDIARRAGVSYSTAHRILDRLECLLIVRVRPNYVPGTRERLPSTYTLAADSDRLGNRRRRTSLPRRREESKNKPSKQIEETRTASANAPACAIIPGFSKLSSPEQQVIEFYNLTLVPLHWKSVARITEAVLSVLQQREPDEWLRLIKDIASTSSDQWPRRRTFVRLHFHFS
jgi:hypothetical protein